MEYRFEGDQVICTQCNKCILSINNDRHSCYWANLEQGPIGMTAMILRGQFQEYNAFEKRLASQIWKRVKEREFPSTFKFLPEFGTTNVVIFQKWEALGDEVFL